MQVWATQVLAAALGSASFSMLFGLRSSKLLFSALGGALTWGVYLISVYMGAIEPMAYALGAAAGALYAEIMARIKKTPVTVFVITSVIPLVPGGALYYAMVGLLQDDRAEFVARGLYALAASGALALGIFIANVLFRVVWECVCAIARLITGRY